MRLVLDSSVIVAAVKMKEKNYNITVEFLERVKNRRDELWEPMTSLWEIGSALDHPSKTPKGTKFNPLFTLDFKYITIDEDLFQRTWIPNLHIPIKAGDRIFLSCALYKDALLITWDDKVIKYAIDFGVKATTPEKYVRDSR